VGRRLAVLPVLLALHGLGDRVRHFAGVIVGVMTWIVEQQLHLQRTLRLETSSPTAST
jgi:hypothetical protein